MKYFRFFSASLFILSFLSCANHNTDRWNSEDLRGEYLGQAFPKESSEIFAPQLISTEFNVRDAAFSPDGNEFFYSLKGPSFYSLIHVIKKGNIWQKPEVVSFSGNYSDIEPCFWPDGNKLFFVSNRPLNGEGEPKDYDIWYVEKENDKWGIPKNLGLPINTESNEFYPSFTKDGTIYFCAEYENGIGGEDLYCSEFKDQNYQTPVNLGDSVNSIRGEFNSFVSPNGDFIMFTSMGWGAGFGGGDLWISFKNRSNKWTKPKNMGELVNSPFFEYCPSLTPDGKFLFFTSNRSSSEQYAKSPLKYDEIVSSLRSTINGSQNIYWISSDFINKLK